MTFYLLDEDGETVIPTTGVLHWAMWMESADRVVQQDAIPGPQPARVSTVFIGLDSLPGLPLLWESRVFGSPLDGVCRRYATRAAAVEGHAVLLAAVRQAMESGPWDHNGECLHCDGLGEHTPDCPYYRPP